MAAYFKDPEVEKLAKQLAARQGVSMTRAVVQALRAQLNADEKENARRLARKLQEVKKITADIRRLPVRDTRSADEIMGFNAFGAFD